MGMALKRNVERNRAIFAALEAGQTIASLCEQYGLSDQSLRAVLAHERNMRIVSPEPFYRALRRGQKVLQRA
jgi:Mor family transcriptional regulator